MPELHNIFAKSPKPVVVDVETTGFGAHDRIVEIAVITLDPETWETQDEYDTLINPERDVGPTGVHGVTAGMVEPEPTRRTGVGDLSSGMRICFTGEALVGGRVWTRGELSEIARRNGCEPVKSVTRKMCDILVAADVSSASGKARKARIYG